MNNDRFKFRAWDNKAQHILDWGMICQTAFNDRNFRLMYEIFAGNTFDFEVMQWTGLYDSEGVEIYEGHEIDGEYVVAYDRCSYVLKDISTGDIVGLLDSSMRRSHERTITRERAEVEKD